jgi:hypothetical protein
VISSSLFFLSPLGLTVLSILTPHSLKENKETADLISNLVFSWHVGTASREIRCYAIPVVEQDATPYVCRKSLYKTREVRPYRSLLKFGDFFL